MYDIIVIKCRKCGKETNSQTKILGNSEMGLFKIGTTILNKNLANCILKMKNRCVCGSENAIEIKNNKIIGVENVKYANVVEGLFGQYNFKDELQQIVIKKLKQIENEKI